MSTLLQQQVIKKLSDTIHEASFMGCVEANHDCTSCIFRYDGENGGYSCTIGKMARLLGYIIDNMEENTNA